MADTPEKLQERGEEETGDTAAGDFFMGIVLMVLCAAVIHVAWSWPREGGLASSAALFPLLIASTLFLMALSIFVTSLKHRGFQNFIHFFTIGYWRELLSRSQGRLLLLTLFTVLFYMVVLLRTLPFEAATLIYTAGSLKLFWKGKALWIAVISIAVTIFYVLSFRYLFKLELPGLGM